MINRPVKEGCRFNRLETKMKTFQKLKKSVDVVSSKQLIQFQKKKIFCFSVINVFLIVLYCAFSWWQVKVKGKPSNDRPPYFDFSVLRLKSLRMILLSSGIGAIGAYTPLFYLVINSACPDPSMLFKQPSETNELKAFGSIPICLARFDQSMRIKPRSASHLRWQD